MLALIRRSVTSCSRELSKGPLPNDEPIAIRIPMKFKSRVGADVGRSRPRWPTGREVVEEGRVSAARHRPRPGRPPARFHQRGPLPLHHAATVFRNWGNRRHFERHRESVRHNRDIHLEDNGQAFAFCVFLSARMRLL